MNLHDDFNEILIEARRSKTPRFFDVDAFTEFNLKCLDAYLSGGITPRIPKKKKVKKRRRVPK